MTFNLVLIFALLMAGWAYGVLLPAKWRAWALFILSVLAVYVLQPPLLIRHLDFILPSATLLLAVLVWVITVPRASGIRWVALSRVDWQTLMVLLGMMVTLPLLRFLPSDVSFLPSRPPEVVPVLMGVGMVAVAIALVGIITTQARQRRILSMVILGLIGVFIILKTEALSYALSGWLRQQTGRDPELANPLTDMNWLGFSYVAFRLIHILRDRQTGKLPNIGLREMLTYIVFFPSLTAGPIDRAERFCEDMATLGTIKGKDPARLVEGTTRVMVGIFKKFVIADSLALFALSLSMPYKPRTRLGCGYCCMAMLCVYFSILVAIRILPLASAFYLGCVCPKISTVPI